MLIAVLEKERCKLQPNQKKHVKTRFSFLNHKLLFTTKKNNNCIPSTEFASYISLCSFYANAVMPFTSIEKKYIILSPLLSCELP